MIQCQKCSADNSDDSRFCKSCGQEITSISQAPTMAAPEGETPKAPADAPHVGRIVSSDSVPAGGFTPGTILADRYRIIGLLGRGGMGEVYRADDLKLGQPVALKFLPPALAEDSVRRERFFAEVRITRQLSHPNICRVYDIGEVDGRHFLSMEYIDGEDLASLMKRIGHLSSEKALDIARQLVAGLSVAHERGVLHRDLKPANIMLDGHGRVRITDFGLAIAVGDESQAEEIAGTPAYMAPEQLVGKGATVRSDIYSLGLILYEIYTGKKAFKAQTLAELREQKETQTPRAPSELRDGIDPVVERVIQRCMEKDPNARPASVAQLAQALPGGDPLAAAIAAGETPSPEMVAASGSREGLRPAIAWGLLAVIAVSWLVSAAINDRFMLYSKIPFRIAPEFLAERSRQFLGKIGYSDKYEDSTYGFRRNDELLSYIEGQDNTSKRWSKLDAKAILFWYRQSPHRLGEGVEYDNPPMQSPGETLVMMDSEGHLLEFLRVPTQSKPSSEAVQSSDTWNPFFIEAGMDDLVWDSVEPELDPPFYADSRIAWEASADKTGKTYRIEAAALHGKPVSFEIIDTRMREAGGESSQTMRDYIRNIGGGALFILAIVGGLFFAHRNLRLGRGDRRNATRLAVFVFALILIIWILGLPHSPSIIFLGSLWMAGLVWILYIAIEPFVRRRWPRILISWARLLSGEWRDPLVARDVLVGAAIGALAQLLLRFLKLQIPSWLGFPVLFPTGDSTFSSILGISHFAASLFSAFVEGLFLALVGISLFLILRVLLRNQKVAMVAWIMLAAVFPGIETEWAVVASLTASIICLWVLMRFGLVTLAFIYFTGLLFQLPITLKASVWYSRYGFAALAILAAIVLYAFYTSLGGRPIFGTPRLDD